MTPIVGLSNLLLTLREIGRIVETREEFVVAAAKNFCTLNFFAIIQGFSRDLSDGIRQNNYLQGSISVATNNNAVEQTVMDSEAVWQQALPVLERVWGGIFDTTNKMLKVHTDFGFALFEAKLNPNIDKILLSLNVLKQVLDTMYESKELDFEESRMALNAIQQVVRVQRVAGALKANCEADYQAAMDEIARQAFI